MSEIDGSLKTLAKGAGFVFFGMIFSKILTYLYRIIIARIGPEEYGLLSLGLAFLGFITLFSIFGMHSGILRYASYYRATKEKDKLMGALLSVIIFVLPVSIFLSFLGFIFAENIAVSIFHNPALTGILKVLMFSAPFIVLSSIFLNVTNAFEKAEYDIISRSFLENVLKVIGTFILVYLGFGIIGATYAYVIAVMCAFLLSVFFLRKVLKSYKFEFKTRGQLSPIFTYSWPLLLNGFLVFIYQWTDTFMLGYFKDVAQVGIYNVALPTVNLIQMFPYGITVLFIPIMTNFYVNGDKEKFNELYFATTKWILLVNSLILVWLLFLGKDILTYLFGVEYVGGYIPLIILSIGYFIFFISHNSYNLFLVYKKTKLLFFITFLASILNIVLNLLLIPDYGLIGAAIATGISYMFIGILVSYQAYKFTGVFPFKKGFFPILLMAFVSGGIVFFISRFVPSNLVSFIVSIIIIGLLYLLMLIIFKVFDKNDRIIIDAIKRKIGFA
ncbi:MAG: flippase [archaeon]